MPIKWPLPMDAEQAERAYRALTNPDTFLREWFWLAARCLSRVSWNPEVAGWWLRKFASNIAYQLRKPKKKPDA